MKANNELVVTYMTDGEELKLTPAIVKRFLLNGSVDISDQEFMMFAARCKARGLNPFIGDVYLIKYGKESAKIVVSKEAVEKRAVRNHNYDGSESGIIVLDVNGNIQERAGMFYLPTEKIVGAWARVYRKDWRHPSYVSVSGEECIQRKSDGKPNIFWETKLATMLEKTAYVRALRKAFPEELEKLYIHEELEPTTESFDDCVTETPAVVDDYTTAPSVMVNEPETLVDINDVV